MTDLNPHQAAVHNIANKVDNLILDKDVLAYIRDHISKLCKMVEDYGQVLQPYVKKLKKAKKRIEKFTPEQLEQYKLPNGKIEVSLVKLCPPPADWIKMSYQDNLFINNDMGVIYRPAEPVNPLLWFGISGNTNLQRKPTQNEKLMCNYVRIAIIHDYELRYSGTPTDSYIFSDDYKGKWFERDKFYEDVWTYYYYDNQGPSLLHHSATAQEKLSQLNRALKHVQADLARLTPAEIGQKEIFEAKPGVAGFTVNIKEIGKRFWKWVCSRRKG